MKRSAIGTLLLAFALLVGVSALCRATKSKPPGMVVRGNFVSEAEMVAARKAAQTRSEPCVKWCGGPISYVTNNPNKIGCSEERCSELYISDPPEVNLRWTRRRVSRTLPSLRVLRIDLRAQREKKDRGDKIPL